MIEEAFAAQGREEEPAAPIEPGEPEPGTNRWEYAASQVAELTGTTREQALRKFERAARDKHVNSTTPPTGLVVPSPPVTEEDVRACKRRMLALDAFEGCGRDAYDIERANTVARELHSRPVSYTHLTLPTKRIV